MPVLDVVPILLPGQPELLRALAAELERTFGVEARIRAPWFDPELTHDDSRGQYDSSALLERLLADPARDAQRTLGVSGVDLFVPVLTYVFGEAQLDGRAAVVSLHRLRPELYGLPADPTLLAARLRKEAVHELGHTYGLLHCGDFRCVMRSSTYVEEIDLKDGSFCDRCLARVRQPALDRPRATASAR